MSETERIVDPYPVARETINAACNAIIAAGEVLHRPDLSAKQKQELAGMIARRARELSDSAQQLQQ